MLSEIAVKQRLNELQERYRVRSSDTIDPELKARISELELVLECQKAPMRGYDIKEVDEWH